MRLAVFTTLKPSVGRAAEIQTRSLENWRSSFGVETVVEFTGPLVPFAEMADEVERTSGADVLLYANADVLFDVDQVRPLLRLFSPPRTSDVLDGAFMLTGQRIDIQEDGTRRLHRPCGMDYFMFRRGTFGALPKVTMGRAHCDSALVAHCLRNGVPVIDASFALRVEHQFHGYGHVAGGLATVRVGEAARENRCVNRLVDFGPNCLDATHTLLPDGRIVRNVRRRPACWRLWNLLTRGGKYWKNPRWNGVEGI